ncbi:MAG TPA: hypothetical protein VM840_04560 [Actinomycetota bacterium]|nr:hypothetical protein [Actinomycetota bacterium]
MVLVAVAVVPCGVDTEASSIAAAMSERNAARSGMGREAARLVPERTAATASSADERASATDGARPAGEERMAPAVSAASVGQVR